MINYHRTFKIEGRGVPHYNRKENLCQLVRDIAYYDFGIKIHPNEIDRVRRASLALRSPILVKLDRRINCSPVPHTSYFRFGNTTVSSVMFRLMDPREDGQSQSFWSRYQLAQDHHIHRIYAELKKAAKLFSFYLDRQHVTNIQRTSDCQPRSIKCMSHFVSVFTTTSRYSYHFMIFLKNFHLSNDEL